MAAERTQAGITLAQLLPGHPLPAGAGDLVVADMSLDSRALEPGTLFFAVPGASHDGRRFMGEAETAGCVAIVAEARGFDSVVSRLPSIPVIRVEQLNRELSAIAGRFYGEPSHRMAVTGVTGTNGKTTCSHLLAQLFDLAGIPAGVLGTLGYGALEKGRAPLTDTGMTTPDAIRTQQILAGFCEGGVEHVAMEVSSHSLDQHRVAAVRFDTAVFTNLSHDHLDYHGDLDSYGAAKARLFDTPGLRRAVINVDDSYGRRLLAALPDTLDKLGYSLGGEGKDRARVFAEQVRFRHDGVSARVTTPWGEGDLESHLLGEYNLGNLLAVLTAACAQGLAFDTVLRLLPRLRPVPGRMEIVDPRHPVQVVVDYAHTPDALEKTLAALRRHCQGTLWCVFGCGGDRDPGKRPIMGEIAAKLADAVYVTDDNPRGEDAGTIRAAIMKGCPGATEIGDRAKAIETATAALDTGDVLVVAGKGHETGQIIGEKTVPFSDHEAVLAAAKRHGGGA